MALSAAAGHEITEIIAAVGVRALQASVVEKEVRCDPDEARW
jgi:hypothetical protein